MPTRICVPIIILLLCFAAGVRGADEEVLQRQSPGGLSLVEQAVMHGKVPSIGVPSIDVSTLDVSTLDGAESQISDQPIEQWIEMLGSEQYAARQRAEQALLRLGAEAFDQLKSVEDHADLEVATRAHYLLGQIKIQWVHAQDPVRIRKWMAHYDEFSESDRLRCIERMAAINNSSVLGALCRIARFDSSPLLSREAALEVIRIELPNAEAQSGSIAEMMVRELGRSNRCAVAWIRTCLAQQDLLQWRDPSAEVLRWTQYVDAEMELLKKKSSATDEEVVLELLHHQLDLCEQQQLSDVLVMVLERMIELYVQSGESVASGLAYTLDWILQSGQWQVLDQIEAKYGDTIKNYRELLYRTAAVRAKQGKNQQASEIAVRAFQMEARVGEIGGEESGVGEAGYVEDRNVLASQLVEMGHFDWAEREWRYVTKSFPVFSDEAMTARNDLSMWLHDRLRFLEAAKLLREMEEAIKADPIQKKRIQKNPQQRLMITATSARMEYYFACHAESQGDYAQQRLHLRKSIDRYGIDADVVIAMYRLQGADEAYRLDAIKRVNHVSEVLSQRIREYPDNASLLNHWAWLIANTEGDFQKALARSQASLKWQPEEASFLDTLARCLYATGDLEGALKQQRKAAEIDPHVHALKRQLIFFEQELAKRNDR